MSISSLGTITKPIDQIVTKKDRRIILIIGKSVTGLVIQNAMDHIKDMFQLEGLEQVQAVLGVVNRDKDNKIIGA